MTRRIGWAATFAAAILITSAAATGRPAAAEEPGRPAAPQGPEVADAADDVAKVAIDRFRRDIADANPKVRFDAVNAVARVVHPTVADALYDTATDDKADARVRTAAFKGLGAQKSSVKTLGPRIAKFLGASAEENRKKKARGDYGILMDPKTNKADTESPAGKLALQAKRERSAMLAEAVRVLDAIGHRDRDSVEVLQEFLSDGNDDLVVCVISMFAKWKQWSVLPDFLDLFEMYPSEDKVNVGSTSVDTGSAGSGDQQAAKRSWMSKYGDPDRRRARPTVVRAFKQAIFDITGEKFETPPDFREYLHRPEVKRKVRAK